MAKLKPNEIIERDIEKNLQKKEGFIYKYDSKKVELYLGTLITKCL